MANWLKKVNSYTNKLTQTIKTNPELTEQEKDIFQVITRLAETTIVVYIEAIKAADSKVSGIKKKTWERELKSVTKDEMHELLHIFIHEYIDNMTEEVEGYLNCTKFELLHIYKQQFVVKTREESPLPIILTLLKLGEYKQNDYIFHTLSELCAGFLVRTDVQFKRIYGEEEPEEFLQHTKNL